MRKLLASVLSIFLLAAVVAPLAGCAPSTGSPPVSPRDIR
jgi:hypothetical protein